MIHITRNHQIGNRIKARNAVELAAQSNPTLRLQRHNMIRAIILLALCATAAACVPFDTIVNVGGPPIAPYSADDPSLLSGIASNIFTNTQAVNVPGANTAPACVYLSGRWLPMGPSLTFTIPVTGAGAVTVETHHAEGYFNGINDRVMGVSVNGVVKIASLDVLRQVGKNVALANTFPNIVPSGGSVRVSITRQKDNPFVNAIRVYRTC